MEQKKSNRKTIWLFSIINLVVISILIASILFFTSRSKQYMEIVNETGTHKLDNLRMIQLIALSLTQKTIEAKSKDELENVIFEIENIWFEDVQFNELEEFKNATVGFHQALINSEPEEITSTNTQWLNSRQILNDSLIQQVQAIKQKIRYLYIYERTLGERSLRLLFTALMSIGLVQIFLLFRIFRNKSKTLQ